MLNVSGEKYFARFLWVFINCTFAADQLKTTDQHALKRDLIKITLSYMEICYCHGNQNLKLVQAGCSSHYRKMNWVKLLFCSVSDVHVSWYFDYFFFLRKPIQIAYKLKCSKTQQVWLSFIFNNELKYFWRHFFNLAFTIVFTRHFWIIYNNKIVMRRLHLHLEEKPRDLPSVWIIARYLQIAKVFEY